MPVHLAFEIYDDVAAYWFVLTLLAFVVVPRAVGVPVEMADVAHPLLSPLVYVQCGS